MNDLIAKSTLSVHATNVLLKNFTSINEFLRFDCDLLGKMTNCGCNTIKELKKFRQDIIVDGQYQPQNHNPVHQGRTEDILKLPPSNNTLDLLPIFSSKKLEYFNVNDLHHDFKSGTSLSDLVISKRTSNVLQRLGMTTIGELMIFPYGVLLNQPYFGQKCLKEVQNIIRILVLSDDFSQSSYGKKEFSGQGHSIDYSSYEKLVTSFTGHCLKTTRNQQIMSYRLNFPEAMPTLQQLGLKYGITRERVRQILKKGDELLRVKVNCDLLAELFKTIMLIISDGGGVMSICELAANMGHGYGWACSPNPLALAQLLAVGESKKTFTVSGELITVPCQCLVCEKPRNIFLTLDFETHDSYHLLVVADKLAHSCQNQCLEKPVKVFHRAFIEKLVGELGEAFQIHDDTVFSQKQGLIHYGERLVDIVALVLEKQGKPMHFSQIADIIRKKNLKYQKISDHYLHAAMLRYDAIEIVKRGTYGLKAWGVGGYRSVSKAIEELLDEYGLPMRRSEVIQHLSGEFSENNISAALHTWDSRFVSIGEGFYDRPENWRQRNYSGLVSLLPESLANFAHYITSNNKYSYKLVLALVFIRGMNEKGSFYLPTLKERFYNFYLGRQKKGKIVEAQAAIARRIDKFDIDEIKNSAYKKGLICFMNSSFFRQDGSTLHLHPILVRVLRDHTLHDLLLIILLKEIDDYFSRIAPLVPYLSVADKRIGEDVFTDEHHSNAQVDKSEELFISFDHDDTIILS